MKMTKALDNNQIDLIMGLEDTEENKEKYQMTKPYIEYNNYLYQKYYFLFHQCNLIC